MSGKVIYNAGKTSDVSSIGNPQDFLHGLLLKLVALMKGEFVKLRVCIWCSCSLI